MLVCKDVMASRGRLGVLNYGMGNLHSVERVLRKMSGDVIVISDPEDLGLADKLVLPGVGHFAKAMSNLKTLGFLEALNSAVKEQGKPILGICLGMQLLAKFSEEGDATGLGWLDANVRRFRVSDPRIYKVPHIGWNTMTICRSSRLLEGIPDNSEFYFVHSYFFDVDDKSKVIGRTDFDGGFVSAVQSENIFGVQFHPEKSFQVGARMLQNFVEL